jgi:hypothetical protein
VRSTSTISTGGEGGRDRLNLWSQSVDRRRPECQERDPLIVRRIPSNTEQIDTHSPEPDDRLSPQHDATLLSSAEFGLVRGAWGGASGGAGGVVVGSWSGPGVTDPKSRP